MFVWVLTQQKMFHSVLTAFVVVSQQGEGFKVYLLPGQEGNWAKMVCWELGQVWLPT